MTLVELAVSLVVLGVAMAALVQLVSLAARQRRGHGAAPRCLAGGRQPGRADRALALERNSARQAHRLAAVGGAGRVLPAAKCSIAVSEESGTPTSRKIRLEVGWTNSVGQPVEPVGAHRLAIRRGGSRHELAHRRAKTLVELMVIVSIMSVVFAASTTTLAALFQLERQFRRDAEQTTTLARLASRSSATTLTRPRAPPWARPAFWPGPTAARFTMPPPTARSPAKSAAADAVEHRDSFRLPAAAAVKLAQVDQPGGSLVRLTIRPGGRPVKGSPAIAATTIDAAIGLPREEAMP